MSWSFYDCVTHPDWIWNGQILVVTSDLFLHFPPFSFSAFIFLSEGEKKKLGLLQRKRWVLRITGELDYDEEMMRLSTISIYRSVLLGYFQSATNWKADPLAKILNRNHYKRLPFNNDSLIKSLLKPTF
jgi:hypothetical protein